MAETAPGATAGKVGEVRPLQRHRIRQRTGKRRNRQRRACAFVEADAIIDVAYVT